jgi:hypothetical protein
MHRCIIGVPMTEENNNGGWVSFRASLIKHWIQPRSLLSPMDADFCAQFIKVLHTQGTSGFSIIRLVVSEVVTVNILNSLRFSYSEITWSCCILMQWIRSQKLWYVSLLSVVPLYTLHALSQLYGSIFGWNSQGPLEVAAGWGAVQAR